MEPTLNRVDYLQAGLTSKNCLRLLKTGADTDSTITGVVGDHSGTVHCFQVKTDTNKVDTLFKTLPGPNAKITCIEVVAGGSSPKILVSFASTVRGYNKKGGQFFGLELNNLTEPIGCFKVRWPNEMFICGQHIYNNYWINPDADKKTGTIVKTKNYYVCPAKIIDLALIDDKLHRKLVPILACQDRLFRVIKDSACQYEVEVCGVPTSVVQVQLTFRIEESLVCYGTVEGKLALVQMDFSKELLEPLHKWEVPDRGSRPSVTSLVISDPGTELFVGRADGTIEVWKFAESVTDDGQELIDLSKPPTSNGKFDCGESITAVLSCHFGQLILCSTFTGVVFGLVRNQTVNQRLNPNYLMISRDSAVKIDSLKTDCEALELRLAEERERYQQLTTMNNSVDDKNDVAVSALQYFAINDSFILQDDASYLLTLEIEVAIDCCIIQCDIPLELIDCERNSAVVSFSNTPESNSQVLATFRCQANTTRLEIKVRTIEGQYGTLRAYLIPRLSPKCAQLKQYHVKPLSLHRRSYSASSPKFVNSLSIAGNFSFSEAHTWLHMCVPEIPEKVPGSQTPSGQVNYHFESTFTETSLSCSCSKGLLSFVSDNTSTISIIKDFVTREATKKSTAIEMSVDIDPQSISDTLKKLFPKLRSLIVSRNNADLIQAVEELSASEPDISKQLLEQMKVDKPIEQVTMNLERIYGLITDLFIDYHKLKGGSRASLAGVRTRITEMVALIESHAAEESDVDVFVDKLNQFWGLQMIA